MSDRPTIPPEFLDAHKGKVIVFANGKFCVFDSPEAVEEEAKRQHEEKAKAL
jgi:hypothetical protein